jgi:tetratricopeptide (TPR) repeat protein
MLLLDTGETLQGEAFLERALAIDEAVYGKEHFEVATDLNSLGMYYLHKGKWEQALPLLERAVAIRDKQFGPMVAATLESIKLAAKMLSEQGAWQLSLRYHDLYVTALEMDSAVNRVELVHALHLQVGSLVESGDLKTADRKIQRAIALMEGGEDLPPELRVGVLLQKARLAIRQDQSNTAFESLAAAEQEMAKQPNMDWTEAKAAVQRNRGDLLVDQNDYSGAISAYLAALQILDVAAYADSILLANTLIDLGQAEMHLGRFGDGRQHLERSLELTLRLRGESHPTAGTIYRRLGELSREVSEHCHAKEHFEHAHKVWMRAYGPLHPLIGSILVDLGGEEVLLGELRTAESHLDEAQALAATLSQDSGRDEIRRNLPLHLVRLRIRQKQLRAAQGIIDEACASPEFLDLKPRMSLNLALVELGNAYQANNDPGAAIELIQRSVAFLKTLVSSEPAVLWTLTLQHRQLGILFRECGRHSEAAGAFAQAYGYLQQSPSAARDSDVISQVALAHANYLRLSRQLAEAQQVLLYGLSALDEQQSPDAEPRSPERVLLHAMIGEALLHQDKPAEAIKYLDWAIHGVTNDPSVLDQPGISPDILAELHSNTGTCLLRLDRDLSQGIEHLRTALRLETETYGDQHWRSALAAYELAKGLRHVHQTQEAKHYARAAHQFFHRAGPAHLAKMVDVLHRQLRDAVVLPSRSKKKKSKHRR